jgi:hypothetical protein
LLDLECLTLENAVLYNYPLDLSLILLFVGVLDSEKRWGIYRVYGGIDRYFFFTLSERLRDDCL